MLWHDMAGTEQVSIPLPVSASIPDVLSANFGHDLHAHWHSGILKGIAT